MEPDRRRIVRLAGAATLSAVLGLPTVGRGDDDKEQGKEVEAVEDLMREHGVLRRALLVYSEAAQRVMRGDRNVPLPELGRVADLFRSFGENYHERSLEEMHVFGPLRVEGGRHAALVKTLTTQHERGREVNDYVTAVARKGSIVDGQQFAQVLLGFVRMYEHHAAIEDTVVFPAWKAAISSAQYREASEEFEELEHQMFGQDAFEDALRRVAATEEAFGLGDLSSVTVAMPPKAPG
jgi:hemerythrin-like domain-containing protein